MARLLVIDDEPNLQYSLVKSLSSETLEVTTAGKAAFPKMLAFLAKVLNRLLKGVTKAQVRAMERTLRQMLANS